MKTVVLELPTLMFVVGTRVALGIGIGLLAARKMSDAKRRAVGKTLVAVGAATTVPAMRAVMRRVTSAAGRSPQLVGATRFPRRGDDEVAQ
jgi:hypothetical protein